MRPVSSPAPEPATSAEVTAATGDVAADGDGAAGAVAWLVDRAHLMAPDELAPLVDQAARRLGATGARVWLVSRDQRSLSRLPLGAAEQPADALGLDGTLAGRAYRSTQTLASSSDGPRLWVPLLDGTERLGVLELCHHNPELLEGLRGPVTSLAGLVGELVVSKGQYTDVFERVRRGVPMGVAAELLWRQVPPLTFATSRFVVTAQLEPWHQVGGDAFDYSLDGDVLHLAVLDGMGHGLGATLLVSVALAAYRNARRTGLDLVATAAAIDSTLADQFGDDSFVTGVLARLQVSTGTLSLLCAAHPPPLLVRDGRPVGEAHADPGLPLGLGDRQDTVAHTSLQPGDRLLLFTDGVIEARSADGEFFGLDRLADLLTRQEAAGQPPPETLRRLIHTVLDHQHDALQDDATLLLLEWAGDSTSTAGGLSQ